MVDSPLPMRSTSFAGEVGGTPTDFLLTAFVDRIMVVITQLGTLGTVLHAEKETAMGGASTFAYRVDTLLGRRDQPLAELCARQLAERLYDAGCDRPLLLCLALEPARLTQQAVKEVLEAVVQHPVW